MTTVVVAILGLGMALGAGLVFYLFAGPFIAGRYESPGERRRENRHKVKRQQKLSRSSSGPRAAVR